jgi:hypothetical protein
VHGLPQCSYAPVQTGRNPRQAIDSGSPHGYHKI